MTTNIDINTRISELETAINLLKATITARDGEVVPPIIPDYSGDIANLSGSISNLSGEISALNKRIDDAKTYITKVQEIVNQIISENSKAADGVNKISAQLNSQNSFFKATNISSDGAPTELEPPSF